jgi:hypothetical protein
MYPHTQHAIVMPTINFNNGTYIPQLENHFYSSQHSSQIQVKPQGLLGFWALPIVRYSKKKITKFGYRSSFRNVVFFRRPGDERTTPQ